MTLLRTVSVWRAVRSARGGERRLREHAGGLETGRLGPAAHDVQALYGLAGGAFDEVVDDAADDDAAGARVVPGADLYAVAAAHVGCVGWMIDDADEGLVGVSAAQRLDVRGGRSRGVGGRGVCGRQ